MPTIPQRCIREGGAHMKTILLAASLFAAALPGLALAQTQPSNSTSSKAQRLEWPRTFSGQPDFAFTREEALTEARTRATREGQPMPLAPTLPQLLNDDSVLDPMNVLAPKVELVTDASGTTVSETLVTRGQSLMERLMSQAVDLPAMAAPEKPDLTEFSAQLSATVTRTVANWQPQAGSYNFEGVLAGLVLQAIVTSPVKYAVINQQRYTEGETFRITVPVPVPEAEITRAMDARMPVSGMLPESTMDGYREVYRNILSGFNAKRNLNPSLGQQTLVLPVRITGITARQVLLDVNGQPYALTIRYAY